MVFSVEDDDVQDDEVQGENVEVDEVDDDDDDDNDDDDDGDDDDDDDDDVEDDDVEGDEDEDENAEDEVEDANVEDDDVEKDDDDDDDADDDDDDDDVEVNDVEEGNEKDDNVDVAEDEVEVDDVEDDEFKGEEDDDVKNDDVEKEEDDDVEEEVRSQDRGPQFVRARAVEGHTVWGIKTHHSKQNLKHTETCQHSTKLNRENETCQNFKLIWCSGRPSSKALSSSCCRSIGSPSASLIATSCSWKRSRCESVQGAAFLSLPRLPYPQRANFSDWAGTVSASAIWSAEAFSILDREADAGGNHGLIPCESNGRSGTALRWPETGVVWKRCCLFWLHLTFKKRPSKTNVS